MSKIILAIILGLLIAAIIYLVTDFEITNWRWWALMLILHVTFAINRALV